MGVFSSRLASRARMPADEAGGGDVNRSSKIPVTFWPKEMPPQLAAVMPLGARYVSNTSCNVIVNVEPLGPNGENEHHLSISHPSRYPTWDEIAEARYKFLPDALTFAIFLPPKAEYVNLHPNCFHLHEFHDSRVMGNIIPVSL